MMTPEPVPASCCPVTLMVTTLGRILAAAALTVPSSFAAGAPVELVIRNPVLTLCPPEWSASATMPPPTPPPSSAAIRASSTNGRRRTLPGAEPPGWFG